MEQHTFEITGSPAKDILKDLAKRHADVISEVDAVASEYGVSNEGVKFNGVSVLGFNAKPATTPSVAFRFDDKLNCLVPNLGTSEGVALQLRLKNIRPVSPEEITKKFGGEPFEADGEIHFIKLRFLGNPLLFVPAGMKVSLPEGLTPIKHVVVS